MYMTGFEINPEALIGFFVALCIIFMFCRNILMESRIYITGKTKHNWKPIKLLNRPCYCNSCEMLISSSAGVVCDCCGICSHSSRICTKGIDRHFKCKEKWQHNERTICHLWVKGNLPINAVCSKCMQDIEENGLNGWRCAWCQRCYHSNCYKRIDVKNECDLGEFKDMIYPPYCIVAARTRHSVKLHVTAITPPNIENWQPLIVIANAKSGSKAASTFASLLRGYLHPLQVIEMDSRGPQKALQWVSKSSPIVCRILIAGGDGTISWILNTIYALNIKPMPSIAIMPFGTGNDLSRVMGWGAEPPTILDPVEILRNVKKAKPVNLDRFDMQIERVHHNLPVQRRLNRTVYVYNYFSIGVDALVTYNFHRTRESSFYILSNRIFNKLLYFGFGTQQIVQRDCVDLEEKLLLYLDNKRVFLPPLQSLVFLNIDSWGAGCQLCEISNSNESIKIKNSISDGIMEVFGIVSSFHIAQLQVGISKPIQLGQGKHIKIILKAACPIQADGEPWIQQPAEINVQSRSQVNMLKLSN